jgi:hypothetical protein
VRPSPTNPGNQATGSGAAPRSAAGSGNGEDHGGRRSDG